MRGVDQVIYIFRTSGFVTQFIGNCGMRLVGGGEFQVPAATTEAAHEQVNVRSLSILYARSTGKQLVGRSFGCSVFCKLNSEFVKRLCLG